MRRFLPSPSPVINYWTRAQSMLFSFPDQISRSQAYTWDVTCRDISSQEVPSMWQWQHITDCQLMEPRLSSSLALACMATMSACHLLAQARPHDAVHLTSNICSVKNSLHNSIALLYNLLSFFYRTRWSMMGIPLCWYVLLCLSVCLFDYVNNWEVLVFDSTF